MRSEVLASRITRIVSSLPWRNGRSRLSLGIAFVLLLVAGCADLLVDPALAPTSLRLAIAPVNDEIAADGVADAFDKADRVRVQILREARQPVVVTRDFTPGEVNTISVTVELEADEEHAVIVVELLRGTSVLFQGETSVLLVAGGSPTVQLGLLAVPDRLVIAGEPSLTLNSVGATVRLAAAVLFATGDTLTGASINWESADPRIASVNAAGSVTAHGEGSTTIRAGHEDLFDEVEISVRRSVNFVIVAPGERSIRVGDTLQLTATAYDERESAITGRTVTWASSDPSVEVDGSGRVVAVEVGSAIISATVDGVSGSAYVAVEPVAPPTGPFHGDWYGLAYESSPTCEYFEACNSLHLYVDQKGNSPIFGILEALGISFDGRRYYDLMNPSASTTGLTFGVSWSFSSEGGTASQTNDFTLTLNPNGTLTGQMIECVHYPMETSNCYRTFQVEMDRDPASMPDLESTEHS